MIQEKKDLAIKELTAKHAKKYADIKLIIQKLPTLIWISSTN